MIEIIHGDCLEHMARMATNSVDALVTDPPAGIAFMGKEWDKDKGGRDEWIAWMTGVMLQAKRVMKPGAHGFVWALPRTSHWTATALENAGFEVRDIVTHVFGSGFPKSLDVSKAIDKAAGVEREVIGDGQDFGRGSLRNRSRVEQGYRPTELNPDGGTAKITAPTTDSAKQWQGWGTALKPASEHWILVRKPLSEKTVAANVLKWGTGAINIDASRIVTTELTPRNNRNTETLLQKGFEGEPKTIEPSPLGRFPANFVLSEGEAVEELDRQSDNSSGASRFFYVAKASRRERNEGCEGLPSQNTRVIGRKKLRCLDCGNERIDSTGLVCRHQNSEWVNCSDEVGANNHGGKSANHHPTVKPLALMKYLIKMITPPGGTVLDPFAGSGSTGVAAKRTGFRFVGIEAEIEYVHIANARCAGDL